MNLKITTYPRYVGNIRGLAKLEFGEDFSVYPLRIVEGKNGLFLSMPQVIRKDNSWKDLFHPVTKEARTTLTDVVLKIFSDEQTATTELPFADEWDIKALVSPFVNPKTRTVGIGSIELNGQYRMENILLSETYPGTIVPIYPMRQWKGETGELQQADIVTISDELGKRIGKELRLDYLRKQEKQQQTDSLRIRPKNSFMDFNQREYPPGFLDDLIRKQSMKNFYKENETMQPNEPEPIGPVLE